MVRGRLWQNLKNDTQFKLLIQFLGKIVIGVNQVNLSSSAVALPRACNGMSILILNCRIFEFLV